MWRNLLSIPFVAEIIEPVVQWREGISTYLGMGCYGSDGQKTTALGIEMLFFLGTAERIHREIKAGNKQLVFSDLCFPSSFFQSESEIALVKKLLGLFSGEDEWEILKVSELIRLKPQLGKCATYAELQSCVTVDLLGEVGLQIGWIHAVGGNGVKDERHFFSQLQTSGFQHDGIGAVLAKFPVLPGGSSGAPYIVKPHQLDTRLLLVETPDSVIAKFRRGCPRGRIRMSPFKEVVEFVEYYDLPVSRKDPIKMYVGLAEWLNEKVGDEYRKVF
ncbi:MAG: hypothetical protein QG591_1982 [Planctomycetota bacterium]|nr:hypothetical protein [Planctomycetota bacterium]MDQ1284526.1 hypothetical protein [Patescibacteria group bacterium]